MLREAWWWLTIPCPAWARRSGLLAESCAIGARARRCAAAWAPHLARCRALLAAHAPAGGSLAVLGSGWLHDVPIDDLAARCARVLLVDGVHPPPARAAARRHPTVRLVAADLSGRLGGGAADWDAIAGGPPDCAASLGLLSQLPDLPLRAAGGDEAARTAAATAIRRAHLALLAQAPRRLLITDHASREADGTWDLLDGLAAALGPPAEAWEWALAPAGELPGGAWSTRLVGAWT